MNNWFLCFQMQRAPLQPGVPVRRRRGPHPAQRGRARPAGRVYGGHYRGDGWRGVVYRIVCSARADAVIRVGGLGFMVYGLWFMVYGLWFMV